MITPADETAPASQTNKKRGWARIRDVASTVILAATIVVVSISKLIPLMIGGQTLWVMSGSMDPAIPVGHYAITQPVEAETLKVGDVITFNPDDNRTNGVPILHRVNELIMYEGELVALITKGDANPVVDKPILPEQVTGKVLYTVPYMGYADKFVYDTIVSKIKES